MPVTQPIGQQDLMTDAYLTKLLSLRLLVGFLGERAQYAWWPTAFYEASSRPFLEPVFAKTSRVAQYHGVTEAARRLHDEHLNVGSYHLFRLPEEIEQDFHAIVQSSAGEELSNHAHKSKDAAMNELKNLADTNARAGVGPIAVGKIRDLPSEQTLKAIASTYFAAFGVGTRSYPYLVS